MLNKTYYVFVFALISGLFSAPSFAQTSGYQRKRFSIGYGGNIGYAMFSRNSQGSSLFATPDVDFSERLFSFNYKHQGQMELVLSNKHILGIQGSYGETQFLALRWNDSYKSPTQDGDYCERPIYQNLYAKMKIITLGVYLKKFISNTAPIGKYWAYKLSLLGYAGDISGIKTPYDFPKISIPADEYHTSFVFAVSKGTSRVYFNRFIVDTNFELGLPFAIPGSGHLDSYYSSSENIERLIVQRMRTRLWGNFFFNLNMNVSLLAF